MIPKVLNPKALRDWLIANPDIELTVWDTRKCLFAQFLRANGYPEANFGIDYFWLKESLWDGGMIPAPEWTRAVQRKVYPGGRPRQVLSALDALGL